MRYPGLRCQGCVVANHKVACDANLARQNATVPNSRGTGEPDLSAEQRVFADFACMTDLDEVIDLGAAADARLANRRAVDHAVGLNLDVIFDHRLAGLSDFVPVPVRLAGKSEAIASDCHAILQQDAVADA